MQVFTLDALREILRQAGGGVEVDDGGVDLTHACYADLGYDSLARLDIVARIKQVCGVEVPDEAVEAQAMPVATVATVNRLLGRAR